MDEKHKKILRANHVKLVEGLQLDSTLDLLLNSRAITQAQYDDLIPDAKPKRRDKTRELLTILPRRGDSVFNSFYEALVATEQYHLADLLCPEKAPSEPMDNTVKGNPPKHPAKGAAGIGQGDDEGEFSDPEVYPPPDGSSLMSTDVKPVSDRVWEHLLQKRTHNYAMTNKRGVAVIINNQDYGKSPIELPNRDGSNFDSINIQSLFQNLSFSVKVHRDLESSDMKRVIREEIADDSHKAHGMFVLIILGHGELGAVYGVDGVLVQIIDIKRMLGSNSFSNMAGKPKLILIQACQGTRQDGLVADGVDDMVVDSSKDPVILPVLSHMLVAYPTSEGNVSWRNKEVGAVFIRAVVDVFVKHAHHKHVADMLIQVRRLVAKMVTPKGGRQGTYEENHLHGNLYLCPGRQAYP